MFRLDLLGRTDLRDAEGAELRAVLAQPKRFALFVYLALATRTGAVRRDTLLAIFWPELDQDHARKALNKAIHFLRQQLGAEVIQSRGAEELALNAASVRCDAVELIAATARGDDFAAAEIYRGDLLTAFYVSDAPEFERWLDEQRTTLRRVVARACHVVAERLQQEGNGIAAVPFARRAVELSHDDERSVQRLLELLAQLGDRAGALYAYEEFARRLASELDAEPSKETRELVERIRSQRNAEGGSRERVSPSPRTDGFHSDARVEMQAVSVSEAATARTALRPSSHGVRRRRRAVVALAIMLIGSAGALGWTWWSGRASTKSDRIARLVPNDSSAPKWILGADFESPRDDPNLGVAVREVVNGVMDESRVLKTVPGDQLADARSAAMMPDTERLTLEAARHLALRSAVGIVVSGRVDKLGASYNVILEATNVADGASLGTETGAASEANILDVTRGLAERLRTKLVGFAAARLEPVSGAKTHSLAAYRRFAAAMADSMEFSQTVPLLREAVAVDSEFAVAWAELGFVLSQLGRFDSSRAAYGQAQRWERRLTSRERMMLEARIARDVHLDSDSAVQWWDRLVTEEPKLGIAYGFRALALRDIGRYDEAITSCKRAIELSPLGARPSEIDTCGETMAAVGQTAQPREWSKSAQGGFKWDLEVVIATGENDWARLDSLAKAELSTGAPTERWRAYNLLAATQAARGQVAEARETLRRNKATFFYPGAVWFLELLLGTASGGMPDRYGAPPGYPDSVASALGPVFDHANELLFSMWAAWRGDTAWAERQYRAHEAQYRVLFGRPGVEVAMSRAWLDACQGRWNRVPELLAGGAWIGINGAGNGWWGQLNLRRWLVADAYEHMGRLDSAAAFFKTMTTATRSNVTQADSRGLVQSFALRRLALLEEQLGQPDSARVHWEQFLNTFTRPDPEFQPWVAEAQRKVGHKRS